MKPSERISKLERPAMRNAGPDCVEQIAARLNAIIAYLDEQAEPKDTYDWCAKHNCPKTLMSHPPQCAECFQGTP